MTLSPQQTVTARHDPSYAEAMEQLWMERHTGLLLLDMQSGVPGVLKKLNPETIRLDNRPRKA